MWQSGLQVATFAATTDNHTIDRFYSCVRCGATFIYPHEIEEHKITTGHDRFKEYPVVQLFLYLTYFAFFLEVK